MPTDRRCHTAVPCTRSVSRRIHHTYRSIGGSVPSRLCFDISLASNHAVCHRLRRYVCRDAGSKHFNLHWFCAPLPVCLFVVWVWSLERWKVIVRWDKSRRTKKQNKQQFNDFPATFPLSYIRSPHPMMIPPYWMEPSRSHLPMRLPPLLLCIIVLGVCVLQVS